MKNKILVTENISIEISKHKIEIFTFLPFNIQVGFEETIVPTLDEDGELFGKRYQLNILQNLSTWTNALLKVMYHSRSVITEN